VESKVSFNIKKNVFSNIKKKLNCEQKNLIHELHKINQKSHAPINVKKKNLLLLTKD
jgi:hypothetical protein